MRYDIDPQPKPRMVRSDKWKKRKCTQAYWAFKDECRIKHLTFAKRDACIKFGIKMPKSWPDKLKSIMCGLPHQSKPDLDNLLKGLADAVYPENDSMISSYGRIEKVWAYNGFIEIT